MSFKTIATPHNAASLKRNQALVEHVLKTLLPHGSGINCKWAFDWFDNGSVKASNSFQCMNDAGFYVGFADFSLTINTLQPMKAFRLHFHGGRAQQLNRRFMLRDYLEESIYESLGEESITSLLYRFNEHRAGMPIDDKCALDVAAAIKCFEE